MIGQEETFPRLPSSLRPEQYHITVRPDIYQLDPEDFTNEGKVEVTLTCLEPTDMVVLHARQLNITDQELELQAGVV